MAKREVKRTGVDTTGFPIVFHRKRCTRRAQVHESAAFGRVKWWWCPSCDTVFSRVRLIKATKPAAKRAKGGKRG